MPDSDLVALFDTESWRHVGRDVLVPLLVTLIFGDVVQVVAADDEGSVHFCGDDGASQDTAADRDEAGEGAFFVFLSGG